MVCGVMCGVLCLVVMCGVTWSVGCASCCGVSTCGVSCDVVCELCELRVCVDKLWKDVEKSDPIRQQQKGEQGRFSNLTDDTSSTMCGA